jgi:hypothetical protein
MVQIVRQELTYVPVFFASQVMFQDWGIQVDSIKASYALQLNAFDGKPLPPLYLTANPPNMLPTVILTGVNVGPETCWVEVASHPQRLTETCMSLSLIGHGSSVQAIV